MNIYEELALRTKIGNHKQAIARLEYRRERLQDPEFIAENSTEISLCELALVKEKGRLRAAEEVLDRSIVNR